MHHNSICVADYGFPVGFWQSISKGCKTHHIIMLPYLILGYRISYNSLIHNTKYATSPDIYKSILSFGVSVFVLSVMQLELEPDSHPGAVFQVGLVCVSFN